MSRFIVYKPTPEDVGEAYRRSEELGVLSNSFTRGKGRMVGFLGEVAFEHFFPKAKYVGDKSYSHDYEINGHKIDIKAKTCSSRPMVHYSSSVTTTKSKGLQADIYYFVRVHSSLSKVWLCGWSTNEGVGKPKYFKKKGESDDYGFTFKSDGYHLPIRVTRRPDSFATKVNY